MIAARKVFALASVSAGAVVVAGSLASPAAAACRFGEPSGAGFVVACRGEFQQTLDRRGETLSLSSPTGGEPRTITTDRNGDDTISLRGNDSAGLDLLAVSTGGRPGFDLGDGDDRVSIAQSSIIGTIFGGAGNDVFNVRSTDTAETGTTFDGGAGDDTVRVDGGSTGDYRGNAGNDTFTLAGGTVGTVDGFEIVIVKYGRGDDSVPDGPLVIRGAGDTRIDLSDTAIPNLDEPEADGPAISFDLAGVQSLRAASSTLAITSLDGGLDELTLRRSVLRLDGPLDLTGGGRRLGRLSVLGSTVDAANGRTNDVLTVASVNLQDSTFLIDARSDGTADRLVVATRRGTDPLRVNSIRGENTIVVNFPTGFNGDFSGIPVAQARGVSQTDVLRALQRFDVVPGRNADPLQGIELALGEDGELVLVPAGRQNATLTNSVTTANLASMANQTVDEITTDLAEGGGERTQVTDTFGIFATGQFGHTWHYGYEFNDGTTSGQTPDYETDNYSIFVTGEVDLGEELGLSEVGVRIAAFAGYVGSDLTLDRDTGNGDLTPFEGSGSNNGGMLGLSVGFDRVFGAGHYAYTNSTVAGFLGSSDVTSAQTGLDGSYDTRGVVVSNKFGIAFAIADKVRLDTRFGLGYTYFEGDAFEDDGGLRFGKSRNSYATLSFEPGLQTAVPVGRFVVTPQARLLLDYKAGYVNSASLEGTDIDFDEGKFSVGGEVGAGILLSESLSAGAFLSAKSSEDQDSLLARLAVKYSF